MNSNIKSIKHITFTVFIFVSSVISAQNITISGTVIDSISQEAISGVNVYIPARNIIVQTNEYGFFSLTTPQTDELIIIFDNFNYKKKITKFRQPQDTILTIQLTKQDIAIQEVKITGNNIKTGTNQIPMKLLQNITSVGGETDIMKTFKLMPGVQSAENKSSLFVRGGSEDQNLIIIDDVPLYYVNHLGGFVSVFNTDALQEVSLVKCAFPAHFGNRLSSVMNIKMKEGNKKSFHKNISIGIISTKFTIEGPIQKDTSSFIFSFRRFNIDLLSRPITYFVFDNIQIGYNFYDINFKINKKINNRNHLYFSFYNGNDKLLYAYSKTEKELNEIIKLKSSQNFRWGNTLFAIRYNHIFNSKIFSNTTLSFTQFENFNKFNYLEKNNLKTLQNNNVAFISNIKDIRLNSDFQYFLSSKLQFRTGGNLIFHYFLPAQNEFTIQDSNKIIIDTAFNTIKSRGQEINYYFENKLSLANFSANIGLRATAFYVNKKNFSALEPRISIRYSFNKNTYINTSYTMMHQNVHLITYMGASMPLPLWLPADDRFVPSKSNQVSAGFFHNFGKFYCSTELYYKNILNLTDILNPSALFSPTQNFTDNLATNGTGEAYGIEFLLQKTTGKLTGWFSYTYSRSFRQFQEINNGKKYAFNFDRPHSISIVTLYELNKNISFSAIWEYGSGFPYTVVNQKYNSDFYFVDVYLFSSKNNERLQDFHKLDLSVKFKKEHNKKRRYTSTLSIDIYNVYNRKNASFYVIKKTSDNEDKQYKICLFPIIPSVSYSLKF